MPLVPLAFHQWRIGGILYKLVAKNNESSNDTPEDDSSQDNERLLTGTETWPYS